MIEKGSDAKLVRIIGGRWDGATGTVISRAEGRTLVQLDNGQRVFIETAGGEVAQPDFYRELGS